jgi:hypothetical protein
MSIKYGSIDTQTPLATAQKILAPSSPGRPRGRKNLFRNSRASEICMELGLDPLRELLKIARRRKTPLDLKIQAWAHCLRYVHPSLSTTHIQARTESVVTTSRQLTLVLEKRPDLAGALEALAIEMAIAGDQPSAIDVTAAPLIQPVDGEKQPE